MKYCMKISEVRTYGQPAAYAYSTWVKKLNLLNISDIKLLNIVILMSNL